jgi:hypothetical protein
MEAPGFMPGVITGSVVATELARWMEGPAPSGPIVIPAKAGIQFVLNLLF